MPTTPSQTSKKIVPKTSLIGSLQKMWLADRKAFIQHSLIFGGLLGLVILVIIPLTIKMLSMGTKVREMDVQVQSAKARSSKVPELKKMLEQYTKEIDDAETKFFDIKGLDELVGTLSKMAAESQIVMMGSRPLSDKQQQFPDPYNKKYLSASYELILEGSYHQVGKFLAKVEQGGQLLSVREVLIRPSTGKQSEKLQCVIQLDAFVRAPQSSL